MEEELKCSYCLQKYENKRELDIHVVIHSGCGKKINPIFNLRKIDKTSESQLVFGKIGALSTLQQIDSSEEARNFKNKTIDSGYASNESSSPPVAEKTEINK